MMTRKEAQSPLHIVGQRDRRTAEAGEVVADWLTSLQALPADIEPGALDTWLAAQTAETLGVGSNYRIPVTWTDRNGHDRESLLHFVIQNPEHGQLLRSMVGLVGRMPAGAYDIEVAFHRLPMPQRAITYRLYCARQTLYRFRYGNNQDMAFDVANLAELMLRDVDRPFWRFTCGLTKMLVEDDVVYVNVVD